MKLKYKKFTRRSVRVGSLAKKTRPHFVGDTDIIELRAFIGLLYLQGAFKSGHEDLESLWATDGTGRDIFRSTMSLKRFLFLLSCLRFDDYTTRQERLKTDKLAPISKIFQNFVANSCKNYNPCELLTIDEMLVPFKGRCGFRMYIPSKPAKYGLKVQILADSRNHYMIQAEVYTGSLGTTSNKSSHSLPTQTVLRLVKPIAQTNRNITADNWYSSIELVDELKKIGLTYVGTIKKNKRQIPAEFLPTRKREINSTAFGFQKDKTMVSFVPKKNKAVLLISSMHHQRVIDKETNKPEIIMFYNKTKAGVDALDEKCSLYSTSRRTRRWPMALFHAILNITGVNSRVLYLTANSDKQLRRLDFLKVLGKSLCRPFMERRIQNVKLSMSIRSTIGKLLGMPISSQTDNSSLLPKSKRKRCSTCPKSLDRKASQVCCTCKCPVCQQCAKLLCPNCQ